MVQWVKMGLGAFEMWVASKDKKEKEDEKPPQDELWPSLAAAVGLYVSEKLSSTKPPPKGRARTREDRGRDRGRDKDLRDRRRSPRDEPREDRSRRLSDRQSPQYPSTRSRRTPTTALDGRRRRREREPSLQRSTIQAAPSTPYRSDPPPPRRPSYGASSTAPAPRPSRPTVSPRSSTQRHRTGAEPSPNRPSQSQRPSSKESRTDAEPSLGRHRPLLPRQASYRSDRRLRENFPYTPTSPAPNPNTRTAPPRRGASYRGTQKPRDSIPSGTAHWHHL